MVTFNLPSPQFNFIISSKIFQFRKASFISRIRKSWKQLSYLNRTNVRKTSSGGGGGGSGGGRKGEKIWDKINWYAHSSW